MSEQVSESINMEVVEPVTQNKEVDPVAPGLRKIFGEAASITPEDNLFRVHLKLKDATCAGGQDVVLLLGETDKSRNLYHAKEFYVENMSMLNFFKCDIFFGGPEIKPADGEGQVAKKETFFSNPLAFLKKVDKKEVSVEESPFLSHLKKLEGTKAFVGQGVVIKNMEDADGFAALFHEFGHMIDKNGGTRELNDAIIASYILDPKTPRSEEDMGEIRQSAEWILKYEMFANRMAVEGVEYARDKGTDLFKNDPELFRMKKFLTSTVLTRFRAKPQLVGLLGWEKINSLLNL